MYANKTARIAVQRESNATQWGKALLWSFFVVAIVMVLLPSLAQAGTGTSAAAQARINAVATGWQNIVQGVGVAVLIIAWSYIGYQLAFAGKTMKDMGPTAIGTSVAGLAPVLVGWMFS